jgi:hypothetical protein
MLAYFRGKSAVSKIIKWRTWGQYSHVGWVEPTGEIFESWHKKDPITGRNGPREGHIGDIHTAGTQVDLFAVKLTHAQHEDLLHAFRFWIDQGHGYDFSAVLLGFTLRRNRSISQEKMFCSEYMQTGFKDISKPLLINCIAGQISPSTLSYSPLQTSVGSYITGQPWNTPALSLGHY